MRFFSFAFALLCAGPLSGQEVSDTSIEAIEAAEEGWDTAYAIATDEVTTDLITWMRLREGDGTFTNYRQFLADHPDWPDRDRLRARAERNIDKSEDPVVVISFFANDAPQTGQGALRLAEALTKTAHLKEAEAALRTAWLTLGLSESEHDAFVDAFGDKLEPFHLGRTDAMLWRSRTSDAERMLPLLDDDQQALTEARIAFIRASADRMKLYNALPAGLKLDAGLAYARYDWLADRGNYTEAIEILVDRSTSGAALGDPFRWSGWRRSLGRWAMREGEAEQAYMIASRHYLTGGEAYADLEWLSGYLSLTYLDIPAQALEHFEKAASSVSSPISVGRMQYWIGRAQEAQGDTEAATAAYTAAATYQTGFYGLLAAERLDQPLNPAFAAREANWQDAAVFDLDLTKAALILLNASERGHAVTFFAALGRTLDDQALAQLGAYLSAEDEHYYTLLLGKSAAARGLIVPSIYFPVHDLAETNWPTSTALALSVARRESEFNAGIGSPVGALGLMQLMPGTAQEVAGELGLSYSRIRLTSDWRYNAALGTKYLAMLQEEFGNSPVMIAAAYNAGPSRPNIWMDERGDPRLGEMDVIDWIEHIPFTETRNYVMRVTEMIPLYQARLAGAAGAITFTDLLVGNKPLLRPRLRPDRTAVEPDVRPIARPSRG